MEISALISDHVVHAVRSTVADGVFAKHLARSGPHRLAVLGSGRLARWAAEAVVAAVGAQEVAIWSPTGAHREDAGAFLRRRLGVTVDAVGSAERAVRGASIVVAATTSPAPVLRAEWVARGATLISNRPEEFDAPLFALGRVITTYVAGVRGHVPPYRGLPDDAPLETLADIVTRRAPGRRDDDETLVCVNPAYGVLDAVVASFVHQRAVAAGFGVELDP
jgi:ornithine cyclodeaminase/alanine dehydrogenase-like protein (mu-crystallin family)